MSQRWRESAFDINSKMIAENKKTQVTKPSVSREIQVTHVMPVISDLVVYNRSVQSSVVVFPSAFSFVRKHIGVVRWVGIKSVICSGMPAISTVLLSTFIAMIYCIRTIWSLPRYGRMRGVMVIRLNLIGHYLTELYSWSKRVPKLVSQVNLIQTSLIIDFRCGWLFSL